MPFGALVHNFKSAGAEIALTDGDIADARGLLLQICMFNFPMRWIPFALNGWTCTVAGATSLVLARLDVIMALRRVERLTWQLGADGFATQSGNSGDTLWCIAPVSSATGGFSVRDSVTVLAIAEVSDTSLSAQLIWAHVSCIALEIGRRRQERVVLISDLPALTSALALKRFTSIGALTSEVPLYHVCELALHGSIWRCLCCVGLDWRAHALWGILSAWFKRVHSVCFSHDSLNAGGRSAYFKVRGQETVVFLG